MCVHVRTCLVQGSEALTVHFTAELFLEQIFSNVQQDYSDSEEEVEDVSEDEDTTESMMYHLQKKKSL